MVKRRAGSAASSSEGGDASATMSQNEVSATLCEAPSQTSATLPLFKRLRADDGLTNQPESLPFGRGTPSCSANQHDLADESVFATQLTTLLFGEWSDICLSAELALLRYFAGRDPNKPPSTISTSSVIDKTTNRECATVLRGGWYPLSGGVLSELKLDGESEAEKLLDEVRTGRAAASGSVSTKQATAAMNTATELSVPEDLSVRTSLEFLSVAYLGFTPTDARVQRHSGALKEAFDAAYAFLSPDYEVIAQLQLYMVNRLEVSSPTSPGNLYESLDSTVYGLRLDIALPDVGLDRNAVEMLSATRVLSLSARDYGLKLAYQDTYYKITPQPFVIDRTNIAHTFKSCWSRTSSLINQQQGGKDGLILRLVQGMCHSAIHSFRLRIEALEHYTVDPEDQSFLAAAKHVLVIGLPLTRDSMWDELARRFKML